MKQQKMKVLPGTAEKISDSFEENLKTILAKKNFEIEDFSDYFPILEQDLQRNLKKSRPELGFVQECATALDVKVEELFDFNAQENLKKTA